MATRQRVEDNELVQLLPDAPYRASLLPDHPRTVTGYAGRERTSTRFCKHPYNTGFNYFDQRCVQELLGKTMTKREMIDRMAHFFLEYPGHGTRGGTDRSCWVGANRCFYALLKEGLISRVGVNWITPPKQTKFVSQLEMDIV